MSGFEFTNRICDKVIMRLLGRHDSTKEAVFGVQVRHLSALRPLTLNGKALSINNRYLCKRYLYNRSCMNKNFYWCGRAATCSSYLLLHKVDGGYILSAYD
jgi:hypothetical protein